MEEITTVLSEVSTYTPFVYETGVFDTDITSNSAPTQVLNLIFGGLKWAWNFMGEVKIFGGFSVLQFSIALLVLGTVIPIVLNLTVSISGAESDKAIINREDRLNRMYKRRQFKNHYEGR